MDHGRDRRRVHPCGRHRINIKTFLRHWPVHHGHQTLTFITPQTSRPHHGGPAFAESNIQGPRESKTPRSTPQAFQTFHPCATSEIITLLGVPLKTAPWVTTLTTRYILTRKPNGYSKSVSKHWNFTPTATKKNTGVGLFRLHCLLLLPLGYSFGLLA